MGQWTLALAALEDITWKDHQQWCIDIPVHLAVVGLWGLAMGREALSSEERLTSRIDIGACRQYAIMINHANSKYASKKARDLYTFYTLHSSTSIFCWGEGLKTLTRPTYLLSTWCLEMFSEAEPRPLGGWHPELEPPGGGSPGRVEPKANMHTYARSLVQKETHTHTNIYIYYIYTHEYVLTEYVLLEKFLKIVYFVMCIGNWIFCFGTMPNAKNAKALTSRLHAPGAVLKKWSHWMSLPGCVGCSHHLVIHSSLGC